MERFFSMRTAYLVVTIAAAALSGTYYFMKLRQECGSASLLSCVRQAFGPAKVEEARGAQEARKSPEQPKREQVEQRAREGGARRETAADDPRRRPEAWGLLGVWRGTYVCAQGPTGLTLTIEGRADALEAEFDFYPVAGNPNVPSGRFSMSGAFDGPSRVLTLRPRQWILRPPPYMMVGIRAEVDLDAGTISGTITDPACSLVRLTRLQPVRR